MKVANKTEPNNYGPLQNASMLYARATLFNVARNNGFVAIVSVSDAVNAMLIEDLEARIAADKHDVLLIRLNALAKAPGDQNGKPITSGQIVEEIARALAPQVKVKSGPKARLEQVHELLKVSHRAGRRRLLVIEDAELLPIATLKHLKRVVELRGDMQRLIGVALLGRPALFDHLGSENVVMRELMQRCEIVELEDARAGYRADLVNGGAL